MRAVVFVTPEESRIVDGLQPTKRYLKLLQKGAAEFGLEKEYQDWLGELVGVEGDRDERYCRSVVSGEIMEAPPKIRTG